METNYEAFYKMKLQNEWGTFIDLKILPVIFFYDVLPDIWVTLFGGMAEYMESVVKYGNEILSNTEFTEYSVFDLNWTDEKAEAKNTRLFWNRKETIFVLP